LSCNYLLGLLIGSLFMRDYVMPIQQLTMTDVLIIMFRNAVVALMVYFTSKLVAYVINLYFLLLCTWPCGSVAPLAQYVLHPS